MLASFEELFGRLLIEVERECAAGEEPAGDRARRTAALAIELLADDPPTARLLSIEILAVGSEGVRAQHEAIERLARLLRASGRPGGGRSPDAAWAMVAAIVAWLGKTLAEGRRPNPAEIELLLGEF